MITKVELIREAILADSITLKSVSSSLVGYPPFVSVFSLEANCNLVDAELLTKIPYLWEYEIHPYMEWPYFPIRILQFTWRLYRCILIG